MSICNKIRKHHRIIKEHLRKGNWHVNDPLSENYAVCFRPMLIEYYETQIQIQNSFKEWTAKP